MRKNGRLVCINSTDVTITGMDYNYVNNKDNVASSKFNITFDAIVNSKLFVISFSNAELSGQNHYLADTFIGTGDSYSQFLIEVERNTKLKDKNLYSDDTKNTANEVVGAIAQSVYIHVQSHSPDQDEE